MDIKVEKLVVVRDSYINSQIIERLDGSEDYWDGCSNKIYNIDTIRGILADPEDDTNEHVRILLEDFYNGLKEIAADRVLIVA
jgi:hypothetical protein